MVRRIALPVGTAELTGFDRYDYDEAWEIAVPEMDTTPEEWARLAMEGAPSAMRAVMVNGWKTLGIGLEPLGSTSAVLGWPIRHSDDAALVLGVHAAVGITARIVMRAYPGKMLHAMIVRYDNRAGRAVWNVIAPGHRKFVENLLEIARQRAADRQVRDSH